MISVIEFIPGGSGCVKGKLKILINDSQIMEGITLCQNDKSRWVSFPSFKVTIDGKDVWRPYIYYQVPCVQKKFCESILKAYDLYIGEKK